MNSTLEEIKLTKLARKDSKSSFEHSFVVNKEGNQAEQAKHSLEDLINWKFGSDVNRGSCSGNYNLAFKSKELSDSHKSILTNNLPFFSIYLKKNQFTQILDLISDNVTFKDYVRLLALNERDLFDLLEVFAGRDTNTRSNKEIGIDQLRAKFEGKRINIFEFYSVMYSRLNLAFILITNVNLLMTFASLAISPEMNVVLDDESIEALLFLATVCCLRKENKRWVAEFNARINFFNKFQLNTENPDLRDSLGRESFINTLKTPQIPGLKLKFGYLISKYRLDSLSVEEFKNKKLHTFALKELFFQVIKKKINSDTVFSTLKQVEKQMLKTFQLNTNLHDLLKLNENRVNKRLINTLNRIQLQTYTNLKNVIAKNAQMSFKIFAYGSITSFTATDSSDLDTHIQFGEDCTETEIKDFWFNAKNWITKIAVSQPEFVFTGRLLTYKYTDKQTKIEVDLNGNGYCGVLNSSLVRFHSLSSIDFPVLAINLKKLLKREFEGKTKPNNYSMMLILITFLQNSEFGFLSKVLNKAEFHKVGYVWLDVERKTRGRARLKDAVLKLRDFEHPKNVSALLTPRPVESPKHSHSLILIKFIEFIAFQFNPFTEFVDCRKEEFRKIPCIWEDYKETYRRYLSVRNTNRALFLVTDPFDHYYSCAKDLKAENPEHVETFYFQLVKIYKRLVLEGIL